MGARSKRTFPRGSLPGQPNSASSRSSALTLLVLGRSSTGLFSASLLLPLLRALFSVYHTRFLSTTNSAALTQIRFYSLRLLGSLLPTSPASSSRSLCSGCTGLLVHCGPRPSRHSRRPPFVITAVRLVGLSHEIVSSLRTWMLISLDPYVPPEPCSKSACGWPSKYCSKNVGHHQLTSY